MATMSRSESRQSYSWWWDSHISPKNSKWLHDNLTDIDARVKTMIKIIEEDADSFARRAEMYYKKRPELMKLVEEFYRAYRALAERYDHATGELRHAQRTMATAFPNQVPFPFTDDSPSGAEQGVQTADMLHPLRVLLNTDDFGSVESKKGLKQLQEMLEALGNRNLGEEERSSKGELSIISDEYQHLKDLASKSENEIEILKNALQSLHTEKEGVLHRYDESVENLSKLKRELDSARMDSRGLSEEASQAKAEVQKLKEVLLRLEVEKDATSSDLSEYRKKISKLEADMSLAQKDEEGLTGRVVKAETEAQYLVEELSNLKIKNYSVSCEYEQCMEKVADLERELSISQNNAKVLNERSHRAENEVSSLNKALVEASEDKEGLVCRYEHCLEKILKLENELFSARDEIERLNGAMKLKNEKLKNVQENCVRLESSNHDLQLEAKDLEKIITTKNEELSQKDEVIKKFQSGFDNEHTRFVQAEATVQTLQNLYCQAQRDQKALALELKNGLKMLKEMEEKKHGLQEEILQVKDENKILNESNSSSKNAIENLESEILKMKEVKDRLEREVGLQMGQTNSLQKEIHSLNKDIEGLNTRYKDLIQQIESVGLEPESVESAIKELVDQNSKLRQLCDKERDEKQIFVKKLDNMKQSLDKKATLESSLTTLSGELYTSQGKVKELRGEISALVDEKAVILSQLQAITGSMHELLERNTFLENSLSGANIELSSLREKTNCLDELCKSLNNDKSKLHSETSTLVVQLGNVGQRLQNLEMRFSELEISYAGLEKEKKSTLSQMVELKTYLDIEKKDRASVTLSNETRLTRLEENFQLLQDESKSRKREFEEELDRAVNAQCEIFVLQRFIQDMKQKNLSLLLECQKHIEASKLSDKVISELESENLEQQVESEFLLDEIEKLRIGVYQVFKALEVSPDHGLVDKMENGSLFFDRVVEKIKYLKFSLSNYRDDKDQLSIENSILLTLFGQLKVDASEFVLEKNILQHDYELTCEQVLFEQREKKKVNKINRQLNSYVKLQDGIRDELKVEIGRLNDEQRDIEMAYLKLRDQYSQKLEENSSLLKSLLVLKEKSNMVEEENHSILFEALALDYKSIVLKQFGAEKASEVQSLSESLQMLYGKKKMLYGKKRDLENEVEGLKSELDMKENQNLLLDRWVKKLIGELDEVRANNTQLTYELSAGKSVSNQKEVELLIVTEKLKAKEEVNSQLCRTVEGLKKTNEGTKFMTENLEKHNLYSSEEIKNQKIEIENFRECNRSLESEVGILRVEVAGRKIREEKLNFELKEISNEFQMWEAEAETFRFDLQISTVREVFLNNKVRELSCVCETLEGERDSKMAEIEHLKHRVVSLESEIGGLQNQLFAYDPVIDSLRNNITSLEKNILSQQELNVADIHKAGDVELAIDVCEKSFEEPVGDDMFLVPNGVSELRHLQDRIKGVQKVVTDEMKRRAKLKSSKHDNTLESAMREIADLKANCSLRLEMGKQKEKMDLMPEPSKKWLQKAKPELSEMKNALILSKDIPPDNISNDSIYGFSQGSFHRADEQMIELWDTPEDNHSLGRIKKKSIKQGTESLNVSRRFENTEIGRVDMSLELQAEKELGVDRLEVPTSGTASPQDRNKKKILERLNFDAQKLKNIQTTVEDLRRKIEANATKKKKAKNVDFEIVEEQLKEVEGIIIQLVQVNEKLIKNVEENGAFSNKKASPELEVIGTLRRKRVADQARKGSEKISRLLIEVEKIQYALLKLEDEKKSKEKMRVLKSNTSINFRNFITGRRRSSSKREKPCLCGCFRPTSNKEGTSISEFNHRSYE